VSARRRPAADLSTSQAHSSSVPRITRIDLGFLLAQASRRWNEILADAFSDAGYGGVRPAFGSVLVPLFEEEGLRIGELAEQSHLAKQTMTTMVRTVERAGLVESRPDPTDGRATRVYLTPRGRSLQPIAARTVARLEDRVAVRLGERRMAALRASLSQIAELSARPV
jgi:DNA-binding MarR family transcriptional regulator